MEQHFDLASFPIQDTLGMLASLLDKITKINDSINLQRLPQHAGEASSLECLTYTRFHAKYIPSITIHDYLTRIVKYCPCANECFLSLLVYFDRMSKNAMAVIGKPFAIDSFNIHRLLIAGIMVSAKFFSDVFFTSSRYAKVGGLSVSELNTLELEFLALNYFTVSVSIEELQRYGDRLLRHWLSENNETTSMNKMYTGNLVNHLDRPVVVAPSPVAWANISHPMYAAFDGNGYVQPAYSDGMTQLAIQTSNLRLTDCKEDKDNQKPSNETDGHVDDKDTPPENHMPKQTLKPPMRASRSFSASTAMQRKESQECQMSGVLYPYPGNVENPPLLANGKVRKREIKPSHSEASLRDPPTPSSFDPPNGQTTEQRDQPSVQQKAAPKQALSKTSLNPNTKAYYPYQSMPAFFESALNHVATQSMPTSTRLARPKPRSFGNINLLYTAGMNGSTADMNGYGHDNGMAPPLYPAHEQHILNGYPNGQYYHASHGYPADPWMVPPSYSAWNGDMGNMPPAPVYLPQPPPHPASFYVGHRLNRTARNYDLPPSRGTSEPNLWSGVGAGPPPPAYPSIAGPTPPYQPPTIPMHPPTSKLNPHYLAGGQHLD